MNHLPNNSENNLNVKSELIKLKMQPLTTRKLSRNN